MSYPGGKKYSKIPGLKNIIHFYRRELKSWTIGRSDKPPFQEAIKISIRENLEGLPMSFPRCLKGVVTQSLVGFLIHGDRRKLKQCEHFGNFYLQEELDPRQKFCGEKCGSAERRYPPRKLRKYMKGWREDKKAESRKEDKEKQARRLEEAGYKLEEARSEWENRHDERMA